MAPTHLPFQILDVFTTKRYEGNPLAVVKLDRADSITQEQKLAITNEFNLSETVFLYKLEESVFGADIFTVGSELPWAGHPTIGSLYCIAKAHPSLKAAKLITKAGPVPLDFLRAADGSVEGSAVVPSNLRLHKDTIKNADVQVLQPSLRDSDMTDLHHAVMSIADGMNFALIRLDTLEALAKLRPSSGQSPKDFVKLDAGWQDTLIGAYFYVIEGGGPLVTNGEDVKIHSRMFLGLIEDPATGSAASALGAYLAIHRSSETGIRPDDGWSFHVEQGLQMGRKSTIKVRVSGSVSNEYTIKLGGTAVETMAGSLTLPDGH